eukprot:TRINITY_DN9721_c0_g2_i1.p1 TRINITY_DN9721_c0_g2~~TRINITY_DN9721_c0_g2_i1.p1  ORF type:complete len:247 (+),score=42.62 TRINITY_DN9721_c0_g2_i1:619-1359(+)
MMRSPTLNEINQREERGNSLVPNFASQLPRRPQEEEKFEEITQPNWYQQQAPENNVSIVVSSVSSEDTERIIQGYRDQNVVRNESRGSELEVIRPPNRAQESEIEFIMPEDEHPRTNNRAIIHPGGVIIIPTMLESANLGMIIEIVQLGRMLNQLNLILEGLSSGMNRPRGMTDEQIANLRERVYANMTGEEIDCAICYNQLVNGDIVKELPCSSKHFFHRACIEPWFKTNAVSYTHLTLPTIYSV